MHNIYLLLLEQSARVAGAVSHIACTAGSTRIGIEGTVRASFYLYNTEEEVATFLGALARVHEVLA